MNRDELILNDGDRSQFGIRSERGSAKLTSNRLEADLYVRALDVNNDQRHLLNTYASYRFTDTWNLSSVFRFGSGPPIPGFFRQVDNSFFLSNRRNEVRLPDYARWDIRVSKAFLFNRWKLTVTGEVLNLLNRDDLRYAGFDAFDVTGRVFGQLDRVLPILPSVGAVIEF